MRSRFLWKLYGSSVLLILVTTAIVGILVSRQVQQDSRAELESNLKDVIEGDVVAAMGEVEGAPPEPDDES